MRRFERYLAGWKQLCLSKGGSITLINSTLSNLHTFFCMLERAAWWISLHVQRG
jgi:hypothetical protein